MGNLSRQDRRRRERGENFPDSNVTGKEDFLEVPGYLSETHNILISRRFFFGIIQSEELLEWRARRSQRT